MTNLKKKKFCFLFKNNFFKRFLFFKFQFHFNFWFCLLDQLHIPRKSDEFCHIYLMSILLSVSFYYLHIIIAIINFLLTKNSPFKHRFDLHGIFEQKMVLYCIITLFFSVM